jgi:hypothetical protein
MKRISVPADGDERNGGAHKDLRPCSQMNINFLTEKRGDFNEGQSTLARE